MVLSYRVLKTTVCTRLAGSILGVPPLDQQINPACGRCPPHPICFLGRAKTIKSLHGISWSHENVKGPKGHQGPSSDVADASKDSKFTPDERALLAALGVPPLDQKLNSACGRCPPHPIYLGRAKTTKSLHGISWNNEMPKGKKDTKDPILMWLTLARTANSLYTPNAT